MIEGFIEWGNRMIDGFIDWEKSNQKTIIYVSTLLAVKISGEPEQMIQDAQEAEGWYARIGELLAEANSWLDKSKMALRPERQFGTEMDRRTELEGRTAPMRLVRDKLENLLTAIKQRLILIESLLAYHRQFAERQIKYTER